MSTEKSDQVSVGAAPGSRSARAKKIILCLIVCFVILVGYFIWRNFNFEKTDNAYVNGHISAISSRITGVIIKSHVVDNQLVHAGDVIAELDPADQAVKVEQTQALIQQVDAELQQVAAQIEQTHSEFNSSNAQIAKAEAEYKRAKSDAERFLSVAQVDGKAVSTLEVDAAVANKDSSFALLTSQKEMSAAVKSKVTISGAQKLIFQAKKAALQAQLKEEQLQLSYTKIIAPVTGRLGKKNIEVGMRIQPGQQLAAIVQNDLWISANFKETQLADIQEGQEASIRIDAFPGKKFIGYVESFSPASGGQFALLPPDNATGNFTKIVQRVPVKIVLRAEDQQLLANKIAPGMSAIVDVDLRQIKIAKKDITTLSTHSSKIQ